MDARIKTAWVAALRSGEYEQAKGALRKQDDEGNDSYCCLGVLCNLIAPDDWVEKREFDDGPADFGFIDPVNSHFEYGVLPRHIADFARLDNNPNIESAFGFTGKNLAGLNDAGLSFVELADVIEENL